jgi:hypothetical protein
VEAHKITRMGDFQFHGFTQIFENLRGGTHKSNHPFSWVVFD